MEKATRAMNEEWKKRDEALTDEKNIAKERLALGLQIERDATGNGGRKWPPDNTILKVLESKNVISFEVGFEIGVGDSGNRGT